MLFFDSDGSILCRSLEAPDDGGSEAALLVSSGAQPAAANFDRRRLAALKRKGILLWF